MKQAVVVSLAFVCYFLAIESLANAAGHGLVHSPLVDHPVTLPVSSRNQSMWRNRLGAWGENFADQTLRLRGFDEVHEFKSGSNGGIDRVAIRRGANGAIKDAKLLEVKTSRGAKPKLGNTRYGGQQMSRKWLSENLRRMRQTGDPNMKKLALDISRFLKTSGNRIESIGEVMHINTRTGNVTGYMSDGRTINYSESVDRLLQNIEKRASTKSAHNWASQSLAAWDQIQASRMSPWLGKTASQQGRSSILASSGGLRQGVRKGILGQSRRVAMRRILVRTAGPIAAVVGLAIDAKEIADIELAYRRGLISFRQRNIRHSTTIGGLSGAFAGAWAGGATGAWLGAFGGPFAEITVPVGAFLGATVGGVGGYLAGSAVAGYAATEWYNSIDSSVRDRFERDWASLPVPVL